MASSTSSADLPPLSPRQQLQNSIRRLSTEDVSGRRRNQSISLNYNPYESHHASSSRIRHLRRPASPIHPSSLRQVTEETDFGSAERDIWSTRSPQGKCLIIPTLEYSSCEVPSVPSSPVGHQTKSLVPLKSIHLTLSTSTDDRPKTSRGRDGPSAFDLLRKDRNDAYQETMPQIRPPKFVEGTMNSRSGAVASTWSDSEYATSSSEAEDTDSDATPRVTRKRRSGSMDLRDFQPPALTSSAIKKTLFRRRDDKPNKKLETRKVPKPSEDGEEKKPKKYRLRKSISRLQFLGEKMKVFGSSSHDLPEQSSQNLTKPSRDGSNVLDERKRKAETAYAEQFGTKKQKADVGIASITNSPDADLIQEFGGNQKFDSSTVRHKGPSTRSRRVSTGSVHTELDLSRQNSVNEHDIRKRPSRQELEKENQQLRELLRQSQAEQQRSIPEELPSSSLEVDSIPPVPPLRIRRKSYCASTHAPEEKGSDFVIRQDTDAVPPIPPQHPDRHVFGNVSNGQQRRSRRESFGIPSNDDSKPRSNADKETNLLHNIPKLEPNLVPRKARMAPRRSIPALPRSVSMIVEEPEAEADLKKRSLRSHTAAVGKENAVITAVTKNDGARKEDWQWPDDVF